MTAYYVAVLQWTKEGRIFAYIPDLPGVTAVGTTRAEALRYVVELACDRVRKLIDGDHPVPEARDIDAILPDIDTLASDRALVPVEVPHRAVKVVLSIDEALLQRVDRAADAGGVTRSEYFASAASERLQTAVQQGMTPRTAPVSGKPSVSESYSILDIIEEVKSLG